MKKVQIFLVFSGFLTLFVASSLPFDDPVWHHVHLRVPEPSEGAEWYSKYMEGEARRTSARFGKTNINFVRGEGEFKGSSGSAVDHIGWSFRDLDEKMKEFEEAGIKILTQPRTIGSVKYAYIESTCFVTLCRQQTYFLGTLTCVPCVKSPCISDCAICIEIIVPEAMLASSATYMACPMCIHYMKQFTTLQYKKAITCHYCIKPHISGVNSNGLPSGHYTESLGTWLSEILLIIITRIFCNF